MLVHLGGFLSWYEPNRRSWLELDAETVPERRLKAESSELTPAMVAQHLELPRAEIALVVVNGRIVDPEVEELLPGDRVEFYPALGGG